jgi:hypothetical protein
VQKKVIKENHTLRPWLPASLRDSSSKASAELTSFKQSSTTTPCLIALLGMAKGLHEIETVVQDKNNNRK